MNLLDCEPKLKLKCANKTQTLGPYTWNCFAYFKVLMHDNNNNTQKKIVNFEFNNEFIPFFKFLRKEKIDNYTDILKLREQLLVLGLNSKSVCSTQSHLFITDSIYGISNQPAIWNILQIGWGSFTDNISINPFGRHIMIQKILITALLPLTNYTVDVLNLDFLKKLKHEQKNLDEKEVQLKTLICDLFGKKNVDPTFLI